MPLKQVIGHLLSQDLIITPRLTKWLVEGGDPQLLTRKVAELTSRLLQSPPRERSGHFSASSAGQCMRRQMFEYIGVRKEQQTVDPRLTQILADGTWRHLRWQAMLLSAGIIDQVEVPVESDKFKLKGTMDGAGRFTENLSLPVASAQLGSWSSTGGNVVLQKITPFGFELKGANDRKFRRVMHNGPELEHRMQVERYFLAAPEIQKFALVYENKDSQDWKEFTLERDSSVAATTETELRALRLRAIGHKLPRILPACKDKQGPYKSCPFAYMCLTTRKWDAAAEYRPVSTPAAAPIKSSTPVRRAFRPPHRGSAP